MNYKKYYKLVRDALEYSSAEEFVANLGYPNWAPQDADQFVEEATNIFDIAHMAVKDMRIAACLTQKQLCERFLIPLNTLYQWESGRRECPPYVRFMMADLLGLITVERTTEEAE